MIYAPQEKKLYIIFEYLDYDIKKYLDKNKNNLTAIQIKVKINKLIN